MTLSRHGLQERLALTRLSGMRLMSAGIIAATLLLAIYMARRPSVLFFALAVGAVLLYLLVRWPGLGPVTIIVSALIIRYSIGTGTQSSVNLPLLLVPLSLGLWVAENLYHRSLRLDAAPAHWPLLGMVVVTVLSLLAGNIGWIPFAQGAPLRSQLGGAAIIVLSAGAFFVGGHQLRSQRWIRVLVAVFLVLGTAYVFGRLLARAPWLALFPAGTTGSPFWAWLVAFALSMALFNSSLKPVWRLGLALVAFATLFVSLNGEGLTWASGWLPAIVAAGVVIVLRWPRFGTAAALLGVVVVLLAYPSLQAILLKGNEYSLLSRQAAIEIILHISQASPLIGLGPSNYYYYTPLYPVLGWYVSFNSHNQYADIIAQIGFVGLLFVVWFFVAIGRQAWQLRRLLVDPFYRAYANACLGGLAAMIISGMLGDWFLPFVYNIGFSGFRASVLGWLFLGGLVAIQRLGQPPVPVVEAA